MKNNDNGMVTAKTYVKLWYDPRYARLGGWQVAAFNEHVLILQTHHLSVVSAQVELSVWISRIEKAIASEKETK